MGSAPLITVLMPAYNAERYIAEAIASVLAQTFTDFELLIIDDGSTDGTAAVIASFSDPRIRLIRNPQNLRLIATLNNGIALAAGRYIARADADDVNLPTRLEQQFRFMESHPDTGICGSWMVRFTDTDEILWRVPSADSDIRCEMLFQSVLYHPTVMLRRSVLQQHELRYPDVPHAEDFALWLKMLEHTGAANLPLALVRYRMHAGQIVTVHAQEKGNSARSLRMQQLHRLGIVPNEAEQSLHEQIAAWIPCSDISSLVRSGEWLGTLLKANTSVGRYPYGELTAAIGSRWYWLCSSASRFGMTAWSTYYSSQISKKYSLSFVQHIRFFLKCLLRTAQRPSILR